MYLVGTLLLPSHLKAWTGFSLIRHLLRHHPRLFELRAILKERRELTTGITSRLPPHRQPREHLRPPHLRQLV